MIVYRKTATYSYLPMKNFYTIDDTNRKKNINGGSSPGAGELEQPPTFSSLWKSIPPVSRTIILFMTILTALVSLQLVSAGYLIFQFNEVLKYKQWWRLYTAFFLLPPNAMSAIMELYNLGSRAVHLETDRFLVSRYHSASIDFAFYLFFCSSFIITGCVIIYGKYQPLVLTSAFDACLTLTWAIDNSNVEVRFYGILPVYGKFYPLLQGLIAFIFGGDLILIILGFTAAYIFNCLDTRSLGPLYGLIAKKDKWYGVVPTGKFHAPRWFIWGYEFLFGGNYLQRLNELKSNDKRSGGQRLGTSISAATTTNTDTDTKASSGGQRLGGYETLGSDINAPRRDYLATSSRRNLASVRQRFSKPQED